MLASCSRHATGGCMFDTVQNAGSADAARVGVGQGQDQGHRAHGAPLQPLGHYRTQTGHGVRQSQFLFFNDKKKGNLFYKILDIIDVKKPKKIMLENVRNLETINNGETFKYIKNELEKRGYKVSYKVIDSKYYNSPQSRKRIYIICDKIKEYKFANVKNEIIPVSTIIDFTVEGSLELKDKYNLEEIKNRLSGWQLKSFNESYEFKVSNGISLFKKNQIKE